MSVCSFVLLTIGVALDFYFSGDGLGYHNGLQFIERFYFALYSVNCFINLISTFSRYRLNAVLFFLRRNWQLHSEEHICVKA